MQISKNLMKFKTAFLEVIFIEKKSYLELLEIWFKE